ncbi:MAG TPA: TPM domain-containing protein [Haloferula sp.]
MRLLCVALLWMMAGWLHAQDADDFTAPPPPADGILDEARMFVRSPERHKAVAEALAALEEKHGYQFYFVLYSSLYGRSLEERAHDLQKAWLGDSPGMVLVLETDSKNFRQVQTPSKAENIPEGSNLPITGPKEFSPSDLGAILRTMYESLRQTSSSEDYAERLALGLTSGISKALDERAAAPEGSTKSRLVLLAVGFGAAAGLISLLVVAGLKRAEAKALERFVFPKANVGTRLGAPFGGGKVSSRSFGSREGGR